MAWSDEQLSAIYDRTSGYCHLCHKKLAFSNYAAHGEKGAWEVEHSVPRARRGTDRINNLYAACIPCNRSKQARGTRSCRAENGKSRAPMNRARRQSAKAKNALTSAGIAMLLGAPFGPLGVIAGGALGAYFGHNENPDRN